MAIASSSASQPSSRGQAGYELVDQNEEDMLQPKSLKPAPFTPMSQPRYRPDHRQRVATIFLSTLVVFFLASTLYLSLPLSFSTRRGPCPCLPSDVPQYFQTSPQLWPGPTATGAPAFMAQTRTFDPEATYVPNAPLQTSIPIDGMGSANRSIFQMMGYLSPYSPSPGFGVNEYPLPRGAEIVQVQMLSRHGSRYPTSGSNVARLGERIARASKEFKTSGQLEFLNEWTYQLGGEILVPKGRQELFDSGVLHSYMYGNLYNPRSKIIVRTTTQDRMLKSAENWMAGFFGLEWTKNATIEVIIESKGFNNSLAGSQNCPNAWNRSSNSDALEKWTGIYLKDAQARFQDMTEGLDWRIEDVYAAQTMCPYETVAYGYSRFCELFTYEEWRDFGYSIDLTFSAGSGFHSPTGRAVGLGYQQEVIARLQNHTLGYSGSNINTTLDSSTETFPLNQTLYFDFSHDTNIVAVLTAFGLRQFADELPADKYPGEHAFTVSHVTPFGARLDIEIIKTPKPLSAGRDGYLEGGETKYIHFILNQRTLPLGKSFPECDPDRKDGWCELDTFLKVQEEMPERAKFDYSCYGDYEKVPYGHLTDGVPQ
ncbi:histidine phosphatase superfamily (branch 2) domain-containing protein [Sarocladium implicatum]|nr:histidine phosphatase superfamily (branch 2) domain-containing protein [Sarocladium implicatum]